MIELKHITCVEDDPDIRAIIQLSLADIGGLSVTLFESGAEAVKKIVPSKTQLIMLDMMMPGMDGLETLSELRKNSDLERTPTVFMTAKAQPNEVSIYKAAGAVDVIVKPFNPMSLAEKIKEIWRQTQL